MNFLPKKSILLFLPVLYILFSFALVKEWKAFYISFPDPTYTYLYNSTNLATGHLQIGNTDHPGVPVKCFGALILLIKHAFTGTLPLYQDTLLNPESYLNTISACLVLLLAFITYLTGAYIFRRTGNITPALAFQAAPILVETMLPRTIGDCPESFITIGGIFFMAYIYVESFKNVTPGSRIFSLKNIIAFGVLTAFLVASKYNSAPLVILVLFLLESNKQRLQYLMAVTLAFLIFMIPALPNMSHIYIYLTGMATHDGYYGAGQERIINPSVFATNLVGIFLTDIVFTVSYVVITLAFIINAVQYFKKKKKSVLGRLITGVWASETTLIMMVAKHCEFYYLIPGLVTFPLGLVVSHKIFSENYESGWLQKNKKKLFYVASGMWVCITIAVLAGAVKVGTTTKNFTIHHLLGEFKNLSLTHLLLVIKHTDFHYPIPALITFPLALILIYKILIGIAESDFYKNNKQKTITLSTIAIFAFLIPKNVNSIIEQGDPQRRNACTRVFMENYKTIPHIIVNPYSGSINEHAFYLGVSFSPNRDNIYFNFLKERFPVTYFYDKETKSVLYWGATAFAPAIYSNSDSVLVCFHNEDAQTEASVMKDLCTWNDSIILGNYKKKYTNEATFEDFYTIEPDKQLASKLLSNNFTINDKMEKLIGYDSKEHHSGLNSVCLNKNNQFGLNMDIPVKPGYFIEASIWRKTNENNGYIVLSPRNEENFSPIYKEFVRGFYNKSADYMYPIGAEIGETSKGWQQIHWASKIPSNYKDSTINFYLFYMKGITGLFNHDVYFDDLSIKVYPMTPTKIDSSGQSNLSSK